MKTSPRFVTGLLFLAMATTAGAELAGSRRMAAAQADRERFVGAWRLVALRAWSRRKDSPADCTGPSAFTPDGHASVHVMYRTPAGGNAGLVQYAQGGYEASERPV